jgi:DNA-binding MarR family transcriptional regulator
MTASRALVAMAVRSINASPVEITGELAEELEVNSSSASRLCDRLQRLGLVSRERSTSDRRSVSVRLTDAGHELLETVTSHRRREIQTALSKMPRTDVEALIGVLEAFGEAAHEANEASWSTHAI